MNKSIRLFAAALVGSAAVACSSPSKMAEMAENVKITCDPEVLEAVAGSIDATVTATYPDGYFHPKAILEVTPVLVYDGGEAKAKTITYQGEKVKDNYKTVSSDGQTVRENIHFDYVEGMEQASLELRGKVKYNGKVYNVPARKIADGTNTTYMLAHGTASVPYKADNYQEILKQTEEGQILYSVNSSDVNSKQLKSQSIKDFQDALDEIKNNDRKTLTGTEVIAYASPEGGEKLNTKLSEKRSQTADKAFEKVTKGKDVAETTVQSKGQDWEGFQDLVSKSNIEDKDLILRVLNMYSDPAVREREIKNLSEVYTSLKKGVLPELRRARFIANVEYKNYTSEELVALVDDNIDVLDEEALLRAATLVDDSAKKVSLYKKAIDKYGSDRAQFNLGVAYLNEGKLDDAEKAFKAVKTQDDELENALGAVAFEKGDYEAAAKHYAKSGSDYAKYNQGVMDIMQGNYDKAASEMDGFKGPDAALAQILANNLDKAESALTCQCGHSNYLRAIIAARKGDAEGVDKYLAKVKKQDKDLAARAEKDVEFAQYR
jgi:hypothetical protein